MKRPDFSPDTLGHPGKSGVLLFGRTSVPRILLDQVVGRYGRVGNREAVHVLVIRGGVVPPRLGGERAPADQIGALHFAGYYVAGWQWPGFVGKVERNA